MNIIYAKNPIWADESHTLIDLSVRFEEIDEDLPFTASPNDCAAHGRLLHANALAGAYGVIAEYVPPPLPTAEELAAGARGWRNKLLAETDWSQAGDVPQPTKDLWAPYRQALRDVPQQAGFPTTIIWPVEP
jgi:hypothetical protein